MRIYFQISSNSHGLAAKYAVRLLLIMEAAMTKKLETTKSIDNRTEANIARANPLKRRYRLTPYDIERRVEARKEGSDKTNNISTSQTWWQFMRDNRQQYGRLLRP